MNYISGPTTAGLIVFAQETVFICADQKHQSKISVSQDFDLLVLCSLCAVNPFQKLPDTVLAITGNFVKFSPLYYNTRGPVHKIPAQG